mmetsp:Transcript_35995/g.70821  ORF Transcript_35995/g.70821 Transcript_35995/m.70821 type:complete len:515 (+) Transcript_35995:88-1632(+)
MDADEREEREVEAALQQRAGARPVGSFVQNHPPRPPPAETNVRNWDADVALEFLLEIRSDPFYDGDALETLLDRKYKRGHKKSRVDKDESAAPSLDDHESERRLILGTSAEALGAACRDLGLEDVCKKAIVALEKMAAATSLKITGIVPPPPPPLSLHAPPESAQRAARRRRLARRLVAGRTCASACVFVLARRRVGLRALCVKTGCRPREVAAAVEEMKRRMPELFKNTVKSETGPEAGVLPGKPLTHGAVEKMARAVQLDEKMVAMAKRIVRRWGEESDIVGEHKESNVHVAMFYLWMSAVGAMGEIARQAVQEEGDQRPAKRIKREAGVDDGRCGEESPISVSATRGSVSSSLSLSQSAEKRILNECGDDGGCGKVDPHALPPSSSWSPFDAPLPDLTQSSAVPAAAQWEYWLDLCRGPFSPFPIPGPNGSEALLDSLISSGVEGSYRSSSRIGSVDVLRRRLWPLRNKLLRAAHVIMLGEGTRREMETKGLVLAGDLLIIPKKSIPRSVK